MAVPHSTQTTKDRGDSASRSSPPRRSGTTAAAFVFGLPLAAGILSLFYFGPLHQTVAFRYVSHTVECVEVVLFCCALSALLAKLWQSRRERRACAAEILPPWNGQPLPVTEAPRLLADVSRLPHRLHNTCQVNRVASVLDFLAHRGSAAELDDQMRDLADADSLTLESSFAFVRFITWAIPILGFLGTVLGITGAIAGVTPERLEHDLNSVTDGLALAFDATALALGLTMITMFLTYMVERVEQSILDAVDRYAARHLAHRFERTGAEGNKVVEAVQQNSKVLLRANEELVKRQAEVWAQTLVEVDRGRAETEDRHQARLTEALENALERTLQSHARCLAALEQEAAQRAGGLLEQIATVTRAVAEQQAALNRTADSLAAQTAVLAQLQDSEKQMLRLQETLCRNLDALASAGTFEQAVHSLTAAVHLLTARAAAGTTVVVPLKRPGVAA